VAEQSGSFKPHRERDDQLAEVLENLKHHGCVRGVSSRKSWKTVESWQSDISSYRTRQAYKDRLV
jgi:hypothetical protein